MKNTIINDQDFSTFISIWQLTVTIIKNLSMQSKKFAFNVGITFIAYAISMLISFIITVFLGRYLGVRDLGLYRMAYAIYGISTLFAAIGVPAAMIKYVAEYKMDRIKTSSIVSSGVITSLLLGIGFSVAFYFLSDMIAEIFKMPGLSILLKLLSPVFPFALVGGALLGLLNGLMEMKKYGIAVIIQSILMLIISVVLLYLGFGVNGVIIGIVSSSVGSCLYLIGISRDYFDVIFKEYTQTTKKILRLSIQVFGANAINLINYQADTLLIGYFLTAADVGYYSVAINLSTFLWLIPQAIQTITYPATSSYWSTKNHAALQTMIDKIMKYTTCILLSIGLCIGFFAKDIIMLIFGNGYIYSVLPLQILLIGTIIFGIFKSIGGTLLSIERADLSLKVTAIGALTNVVLNLLLIPRLGISGAAMATITSFLLMTFLSLNLIYTLLQIKIDAKWYIKILILVSLTIFSFTIISKLINQYVSGSILLFIYGILTIRFLFTKDDKKYFLSIYKKEI